MDIDIKGLRLRILKTKCPTSDQSRLDQIRSDRNGIRSEIYTPVLTSDQSRLVQIRSDRNGIRSDIYTTVLTSDWIGLHF